MNTEEYLQLLSSCRYVIMNHLRQQGLGNIIISLYMGASLFIQEINPIYHFLKKQGANIYSMKELSVANNLSYFKLSEKEIEENRKILKHNFSESIILEKVRRIALLNTTDYHQ